MPRKQRMYLAGIPAHVVHRGNNRSPCFFAEADYQYYLSVLFEAARRYTVAVHAYVLMTNHVHLLMTPTESDGISRLMQHIGRCFVRKLNHENGRSGTLWEGRHKASLVSSDEYLLACHRYIELNPVRAGMVESPDHYRWSSYRWHAWRAGDYRLSDHALVLGMGTTDEQRCGAYRDLFSDPVAPEFLQQMRRALAANYPLGDAQFTAEIARQLGRSPGYAQRGRPWVNQHS